MSVIRSSYAGRLFNNFRKEHMRTVGFILLIIGTLGLLANELFFDWGRVATIIFAVANLLGLLLILLNHDQILDSKTLAY